MELILIRHGKAADNHPDGDFHRQLTEKGHIQSVNVADVLSAFGKLPDLVLTGPLVRARQTADAICRRAELGEPLVVPWLACGMLPQDALDELSGYRAFKRIAIVGHEPDFSTLVEWLLGAAGGTVEFKKAAVAGLQIEAPARLGRLLFLVPPIQIPSGTPDEIGFREGVRRIG